MRKVQLTSACRPTFHRLYVFHTEWKRRRAGSSEVLCRGEMRLMLDVRLRNENNAKGALSRPYQQFNLLKIGLYVSAILPSCRMVIPSVRLPLPFISICVLGELGSG